MSRFGTSLTLAVICTISGMFLGLFMGGIQDWPQSKVLAVLSKTIELPTRPFMCQLGQHGNLPVQLRDIGIQADSLGSFRTLDDENMLVVSNGQEIIGIRFTTFEHQFTKTGCSRIAD